MNATQLQLRIEGWLREHDLLDRDLHFYNREAWCERGEQYGRTADLTLTLDGAMLYDVVHSSSFAVTHDAFVEFLATLGYWYEIGYMWSMHLYPTETT